jgi:hypothetical protein
MIHANRWSFLLSLCLMAARPCSLKAQEAGYLAVIPTFHDRLHASGRESPLQLQRQQFILFVYRNAVAVYTEADFVNTGNEALVQEFALPSTGHDENGDEPGGRISSGILSTRLWVGGERISPQLMHEGDELWYTIRAHFGPGERLRLKAVFWAQTSLADVDSLPGLDTVAIPVGNRAFLLDLYHAGTWNGAIETIDITVVPKGGMTFHGDAFSAEPATYDLQDSTMTWSLRDVEPSGSDNIVVSYTPAGAWGSSPNTMARLSTYIVMNVYDSLIHYAEMGREE